MKKVVIVQLLILVSTGSIWGQLGFTFHGKNVKQESIEHFLIPITDGTDSTFIPISIFNGKKDGPVLGVTAGVHGFEYPPIMAGQKLIHEIDPVKLTGTIILVQVANLASFSQRSPFINPIDGKNLNRSFPGDKNGSVTERIAYFLAENVISRSDFFLDMHAGDASEDLMPYGAYYHHDQKPDVSAKSRSMAAALGFDYVSVFNMTHSKSMLKDEMSLYCSGEAFKRDIPSIDLECGKLGQADPLLTQRIVSGFNNLLRHLSMYEGKATMRSGLLYINKRFIVTSKYKGIFYPKKTSGEYVTTGMELGTITDFFGKELESVVAANDGILLYMLGTPPVNKDETIASIGNIN